MKPTGTFTALVTPFKQDGSVDEEAFRRLIRRNLEQGVDGLVPCGTTGETPTLSADEVARVISIAVEEADGQVPVIAGSGTNNTRTSIANTRRVKELGCDAALVVTPYYNKPSQAGMEAHYRAIVEAVPGFPVVLYNVPGRTGTNLLPATVENLCELPEVVAVKEASGNLAQVAEILERCGSRIQVLSGDDALSLPMYGLGAHGVISVASNVDPKGMSDLYRLHQAGKASECTALQARLNSLFVTLFVEPNPQPAKAALAMMGEMTDAVRLPLMPATESTRERLREILKGLELVQEEGS